MQVLVIMYFVPSPSFLCTTAPHCEHFEDTYDAFVNMEHSAPLVLALLGNLLSIAFFNAFGACRVTSTAFGPVHHMHEHAASIP